jgi:hypothetical protein
VLPDLFELPDLPAATADTPVGSRDWSAVPGSPEADRLLMNRRIGYFGGAFFLLSVAFYVRNVALIAFMERTWPPFGHPSLLLHSAAIALAGLQWLLCKGGRRSAGQLNAIAGSTVPTNSRIVDWPAHGGR